MQIQIDEKSGFCFGVINAIKIAEEQLEKHGSLFCLGDIVHNNKEIERLKAKGLIIVNHQDIKNLYNTRLLIRAHGEPPATYQLALENNLEIIDASCPVVLKLQGRIRKGFSEMIAQEGQIVIFGKHGHAEVNGLLGQTNGKAIVVGSEMSNLDQIDYTIPITLYSQTTQSIEGFQKLVQEIKNRIRQQKCKEDQFRPFDTICRQVANRGPHLAEFAKKHEVIVFVSGKKSSNGLYLYSICKKSNDQSYMISDADELNKNWFAGAKSVGICGATSTPRWLMEDVKNFIFRMQ
jgi:4-hydroxy-3-methylbut-2-en-1-yl diphosphate reductase